MHWKIGKSGEGRRENEGMKNERMKGVTWRLGQSRENGKGKTEGRKQVAH